MRLILFTAVLLGLTVLSECQRTTVEPNGIVVEGGQNAAPEDKLSIFQTMRDELMPLARHMNLLPPSLTSRTPYRQQLSRLAEKHPMGTLAIQIVTFVKALEFLKDESNRADGPLSQVEDHIQDHIDHKVPRPEYYVQVSEGDFIVGGAGLHKDKCQKLYVSGTNKFEFVEAAAGAPRLFDGYLVEEDLTGPEVVRRVLDDAVRSEQNVIRFNAFAVDQNYAVLTQNLDNSISVNEGVLKGLDYILDEANKRGLRVIPVFTDYFANGPGSPLQYLAFAGVTGGNPTAVKAQFYTNVQAQTYYQNYIRLILERTNTYNGRVYKDDPTVLGWDIANEPRCEDATICTENTIPTWVQDTYNFIKSIDNKHLVTCGTDGFYDYPPQNQVFPAGLNPYVNAGDARADFPRICAIVDFCEFNTYPDLWGNPPAFQQNPAWIKAWIEGHSNDAAALHKPVIVKEFGMQPTNNRTEFYRIFYTDALQAILDSRDQTGGLKGALYFQAFVDGTRAVWWTLDNGGRFGIFPEDPEFRVVRRFSDEVEELNDHKHFICPNNPLLEAVKFADPKCRYGKQGPDCQDINECVLGLDACDDNAACINTVGGYECKCYAGFIGDGKTCLKRPLLLERIREQFYTNDEINCASTTQNVVYPTTAPGYVEDPTGYSQVGGNCNRVNVTLTECKIACYMAQECTSFFWDPLQQSCCLKKNECPYTTPNVPGCQAANAGDPTSINCSYPIFVENSPVPPIGVGTYTCSRGVTYYKRGAELPAGCAEQTPP